MNNYIDQLIGQFHESIKRVPLPSLRSEDFDHENEGETEDFQYAEQYMYGDEQPLSEIFGIEKIYLPNDKKLTDKQVEILAGETEKLWNAYHFYPDFPERLPSRSRYRKMREYWDDKQVFIGAGEVYIEFCDYEEANCPFPGYCKTCEEISVEFEHDQIPSTMGSDNEELPEWVKDEKDNDEDISDIDVNKLLPTPEEAEKFVRDIKKEEIKEIIKNGHSEDHISGIHNYCDRWCEKCTYTKQCASFALEKEIYSGDEDKDIQNEAFWDKLSLMFEATMELLEEKMQEFGITMEDNEEDYQINTLSVKDKTKTHPLVKTAKTYSHHVHKWISENEQKMEFVLSDNSFDKKKISYKEAIETILWYYFFIGAKLHRAISGYYKKDVEGVTKQDMNGSAKIALIAVERSIGSWGILLQRFSHCEDEIFNFIKTLGMMQNNIKLIFPDAENFIRPGFDE